MLKQSITSELVQMEWVKKWDGVQSQVSGSSMPIVQLPPSTEKKDKLTKL
ncbi:hypothetical protein [Paenibacillus larvae]|nr:hypothetical protein [Paenibacillus larvae]